MGLDFVVMYIQSSEPMYIQVYGLFDSSLDASRPARNTQQERNTGRQHIQLAELLSSSDAGPLVDFCESSCAGSGGASPFESAEVSGPSSQAHSTAARRTKQILYVKTSPQYKYQEWCAFWERQGGRCQGEPGTPPAKLTKTQFQDRYVLWRQALLDGPPDCTDEDYVSYNYKALFDGSKHLEVFSAAL
eukprot:TRINITY_DN21380_c0_g1_i1.p1 TRINITY_DN21380_c0_g1~~TRINITY_DN21380_c0_g1_i1.p1  ORF type:complete len:189 (-),score=28.44 TRINITY_DN21380_c0_g1_i1:37-603(-)